MTNRKWTQEELNYLIEVYPHTGVGPVAEKLSRTKNAIKVKAARLKLDRRSQNDYKRWSRSEISFLKNTIHLKVRPMRQRNWVAPVSKFAQKPENLKSDEIPF